MTARGRKILYGILITLGCLAAIVVAGIISFMSWVSQPGELIEPTQLLSADSTGYAEWTLRTEDPGTEGFLRLLLQATRSIPSDVSRSLPPGVDGWLRDTRESDAVRDIERFLPGLAAWTLHPATGGSTGDLHLVSVSAKGLGNQLVLADWIGGFLIARAAHGSVHAYQGENIYQLGIPERNLEATFFARRGAVFATSDLDTARQAVDLLALEDTPHDRPPTTLEARFATTRGADPLRVAINNEHGELLHLWETLGGQSLGVDPWYGLEGATATGGLGADGSFHGVLNLLTGDRAADAAVASALAEAFRQRLADLALRPDIQGEALSDRIRIDVRVPHLVDALAARLHAERGPRQPR